MPDSTRRTLDRFLPATVAAVVAAIPAAGFHKAIEIHARVGVNSRYTTDHVLRALAAAGRLQTRLDTSSSRCVRLYARLPALEATAGEGEI